MLRDTLPRADEQPRTLYNRITGQSLDRVAALGDGIFALAPMLMALEIHVPPPESVSTETELIAAPLRLGPTFLTSLTSFLPLGIFRTGQQTQLSRFAQSDRDLAWVHFTFLAAVSVLPSLCGC